MKRCDLLTIYKIPIYKQKLHRTRCKEIAALEHPVLRAQDPGAARRGKAPPNQNFSTADQSTQNQRLIDAQKIYFAKMAQNSRVKPLTVLQKAKHPINKGVLSLNGLALSYIQSANLKYRCFKKAAPANAGCSLSAYAERKAA
jgi:hypothetical protein